MQEFTLFRKTKSTHKKPVIEKGNSKVYVKLKQTDREDKLVVTKEERDKLGITDTNYYV